jgi:hypothetical protein
MSTGKQRLEANVKVDTGHKGHMTVCFGHTICRGVRCLYISQSKIHEYRRTHLKIIKVTWSWEPTTLRTVYVILICYGWHVVGTTTFLPSQYGIIRFSRYMVTRYGSYDTSNHS